MELYYSVQQILDPKYAFRLIAFSGIRKGLTIEKDPQKRVLSQEVIKSSIQILEKNLFSLLINEKREFQDFSSFLVAKENAKKILQALALTCRFVEKGQLASLFFNQNEKFLIKQKEEQLQLYVSGEHMEAKNVFCLPEILLVKNQNFYLYSITLSKRLIGKLDVKLSAQEIKEIKEDYEDEISFELANSRKNEQNLSPIPFLKLKDRTGAFAHLGFKYGEQVVFHSDSTKGFKRCLEEEKLWEEDLLKTGYQKKISMGSNYYCPLDKVAKSLKTLLDCGWDVVDTYDRKVIQGQNKDLKFEKEKEIVHLSGAVDFLEKKVDLKEVYGAFCRRQTFIELSKNTVGLIDSTAFAYQEDVGMQLEENAKGISFHFAAFNQMRNFFKEAQTDFSTDNLQNFEPIQQIEELKFTEFTGILYPYQKQGVNWLCSIFSRGLHGLLADDMGLGKTIQIIAFLSLIDFSKVLIVVPTSLIIQWKREFEKFYPNVSVCVFHGKDKKLDSNDEKTVFITSYGMVREYTKIFSQKTFDLVILDEAQAIKNSESLIFEAVCSLRSRCRLSMSGTPIENRIEELLAQFEFLLPGLMKNEQFLGLDISPYTKRKIKELIAPYFMRRRKEDVLKDLPEKIEQIVYVEMDEQERASYEITLKEVKEKKVGDSTTALEAILRLRQHCCLPRVVRPEYGGLESKFQRVMQDLLEIAESGQKVILYSSFISVLEMFRKQLINRGLDPLYLDGTTGNRQALVEIFQTDKSKKIFLISLKAGGIGLNLTAADYVLVYDPWWNEAAENQAIDRAHRIGRGETVIARRYIVAESIEEKIYNLKLSKSKIYNEILNEQFDPNLIISSV